MNVKKRVKYDKRFHRVGLVAFVSAWDMDDLPDGAWQCMIEEGVQAWADEYGVSIDPNDGFHEYLKGRDSDVE